MIKSIKPVCGWNLTTQDSDGIVTRQTYFIEKAELKDGSSKVRVLIARITYDKQTGEKDELALGFLGRSENDDNLFPMSALNSITLSIEERFTNAAKMAYSMNHGMIKNKAQCHVADYDEAEFQIDDMYGFYRESLPQYYAEGNYSAYNDDAETNMSKQSFSRPDMEKKVSPESNDDITSQVKQRLSNKQKEDEDMAKTRDEILGTLKKMASDEIAGVEEMKKLLLDALQEKLNVVREIRDGLDNFVKEEKELRQKYGVKNVRAMATKLGYDYDKLVKLSADTKLTAQKVKQEEKLSEKELEIMTEELSKIGSNADKKE